MFTEFFQKKKITFCFTFVTLMFLISLWSINEKFWKFSFTLYIFLVFLVFFLFLLIFCYWLLYQRLSQLSGNPGLPVYVLKGGDKITIGSSLCLSEDCWEEDITIGDWTVSQCLNDSIFYRVNLNFLPGRREGSCLSVQGWRECLEAHTSLHTF